MRKLLLLLTVVGISASTAAFDYFAGQGAPINMAARQETYRGDPLVVVSWSDTNSQTVVRTDVRRRSTGADTFWTVRGYTTGKGDSVPGLRARMTFRDGAVSFAKSTSTRRGTASRARRSRPGRIR
jgi:hypothetical protein